MVLAGIPSIERKRLARLRLAGQTGNIDKLHEALEMGADINMSDGEGTTIIHAVLNNQLDFIKVAISLGADPSLDGGAGKTALDWAELTGRSEIAKYLRDELTKNNKLNSRVLAPTPEELITEAYPYMEKSNKEPVWHLVHVWSDSSGHLLAFDPGLGPSEFALEGPPGKVSCYLKVADPEEKLTDTYGVKIVFSNEEPTETVEFGIVGVDYATMAIAEQKSINTVWREGTENDADNASSYDMINDQLEGNTVAKLGDKENAALVAFSTAGSDGMYVWQKKLYKSKVIEYVCEFYDEDDQSFEN